MRSVPSMLKGAFRSALRVALKETVKGVEANNNIRAIRAWKLLRQASEAVALALGTLATLAALTDHWNARQPAEKFQLDSGAFLVCLRKCRLCFVVRWQCPCANLGSQTIGTHDSAEET